jgi:O-antigen ligase
MTLSNIVGTSQRGVGPGERRRAQSVLVSFLAGLFSFEVAFLLFIFAGRYKGDPRLSWVPVDITLLFLLLSFAAAIWIILVPAKLRLFRPGLVVTFGLLLFLAWMVVSAAWTPSRVYGTRKAMELATLCLWAGLGPALIISPSAVRFRRFCYAAMIFAATLAAEGLYNYMLVGVVYGDTDNYLGLGRVAGFASAVVLAGLSSRNPWRRNLLLWLLLALLAFVLWTAGGRGPFFAFLATVLVMLLGMVRLSAGTVRRRVAMSFLGLLIGVGIVVASVGPESRTLARLTVLFTHETGGGSAGERLIFYKGAIDIASTAPLMGHGVGSWPVMMGFGDVLSYPHNIFLEILAEGGVIGLLLFLLAVSIGLWHLFSNRAVSVFSDPVRLTVLLMFVNTFMNAQFSGDLSANRLLWCTIGLMAVGLRRDLSPSR